MPILIFTPAALAWLAAAQESEISVQTPRGPSARAAFDIRLFAIENEPIP